jgi:hypothetical protein
LLLFFTRRLFIFFPRRFPCLFLIMNGNRSINHRPNFHHGLKFPRLYLISLIFSLKLFHEIIKQLFCLLCLHAKMKIWFVSLKYPIQCKLRYQHYLSLDIHNATIPTLSLSLP